jgi:hypothetical protein
MALPAPLFATPAADTWLLRSSPTTVQIKTVFGGSATQFTNQELSWTTNGGSTWNTTGVTFVQWQMIYEGTPTYYCTFTVAANTWPDEAVIQLRARYFSTYMDPGGGQWSNYVYRNLRAADAPAAPTITAPTAGASVTANPTVTWTPAETQSGFEIEVRTATAGGGSIVYDDGESSNVTSWPVLMDTTGVNRYIRVRTYYNGIGPGAWAERQVVTSFLPPLVPTFTTSKIDPNGFGISDTILFSITNPAPSGGSATVGDMSIEYRKQGTSDAWTMIDSSIGLVNPFRWRAPHGSWEFRVNAKGTNGTSTYSATGQPQTVTLRGVLLNMALTPSVGVWMLFNGDEATEGFTVESALIKYAGREFPVVEFGESSENTIDVSSLSLKTRDDLLKLRTMLTSRDVVLYRDRRGRRLYGLLTLTEARDTTFGYEIGLHLDRLDYTNANEIAQV